MKFNNRIQVGENVKTLTATHIIKGYTYLKALKDDIEIAQKDHALMSLVL